MRHTRRRGFGEDDVSQALLASARAGDLTSLERLLQACEAPVFRLAFLMLRDNAASVELARRVLLDSDQTLRNAGDFPSFRNCLLRQTIEQASGHHPPAPVMERPDTNTWALPAEIAATWGAQHRAVLVAIERLPQRCRLVLYLRFFLDLSLSDSAAVLGLDMEAAASLANSTLDQLASQIVVPLEPEEG